MKQGFVYEEREFAFTLDTYKALQHKLNNCNKPIATAQCKSKGQLRLKFSTAGYETFRSTINSMYLVKPDDELMKDLAVKHTSVTYKNGVTVQELYSIFNKLKNGCKGNRLKFTVNLYHTTSSALVNGLCRTSYPSDREDFFILPGPLLHGQEI